MTGLKRTDYCGTFTAKDCGREVVVAGWVQRQRDLGALIFVDLRDRTGIVQLAFDDTTDKEIFDKAFSVRSEFVLMAKGTVRERSSKNMEIPTGEVEIFVTDLRILGKSETPPFEIIENCQTSELTRLKYRYLDLRRPDLQKNILMRHKITKIIRDYFDDNGFIEIETPILVKSTPEGARDFLVPSRLNPGKFYALPQSPQTFKQLLMVAGYDRYFQIVRCFRDEDLRADRQPEFTQIDCEMSFVEQEDVLNIFERFAKTLFKDVLGVELNYDFPRMSWHEAMEKYGSDKPDIRFGMEFCNISDEVKGKDFVVFDSAEYVGAIVAEGCASYTRKQIDSLTDFVKRPQVGAKGLVWIRVDEAGIKSSIDKFYTADELASIAAKCGAKVGDLILILAGEKKHTLSALNVLRLEMGDRLGLRDPKKFAPLWVVDFPLLEWDEETQRFYAMHHPFTSPKPEDVQYMDTDPGRVRANAYDFCCNGVEVGGGSVRIFDSQLQQKMFNLLGFTPEQAEAQFGFLMNAFKFGAPPHAGIAFGFDRFCSLFGGSESIRDYIAFPKNNQGRDVMVDSPTSIDPAQLVDLGIKMVENNQ